jgi:hypothetical protein
MSVESVRDDQDVSPARARVLAASPPVSPPAIVRRADLPVDYVLATSTPGELTNIDRVLLESARVPGQKAYVARYRLATLGGDYLARLTRDGSDWVFTCPFERYAAPEIAPQVATAAAIDQITHVSLVYSAPAGGGTIQRSQEFQSVSVRADGIIATLRIGAVPDQDEIYNALTNQGQNARLTVWREPRIGVPAPQSPPEAATRMAEIRALTTAALAEIEIFPFTGATRLGPVLLESMTAAPGFQTGDRMRIRSLDGTQCLVGAASKMNFTPVVSSADATQQVAFFSLSAIWRTAIWNAGMGGAPAVTGPVYKNPLYRPAGARDPVADLRNVNPVPGVSTGPGADDVLFIVGHPWGPPPGQQPIAMCRLTMLPPSHPAQVAREALVARKKAELEALQHEWATSWFTVRQPSLPLDLPPQPFCIPAETHPNVYAGIKPTGGGTAGLRAITCDTNVYYQDLQQRQRFYYLPDRFELTLRNDATWPRLRIRATVDPDKFLVEYAAGPAVDRDRLQRHANAVLLAEANRLATSPVQAVEFEPLLGDNVSLALMVPARSGWQQQSRPGTVIDLYHPFTDVVTLDSAGLRLLYDALFDVDATPFRGTIDVALGTPSAPWARHKLPFVARVTGSRDAFWNAAFDPAIAATRQRQIDVVADAAVFTSSPTVAVLFEHGGVVLLAPTSSRGTTNIAQPIGDYVLGVADSGTYRYQLKGSRGGADVTSDWKTGESSTLRLASW